MKKNINITVDIDLYDEAKKRGLNISQTVNDSLRESLKPKKADFVAEDLTLEIVAFGKNLGLSGDEAVFTHDNLNIDAPGIWKNYKEQFKPKFNLYDYMEIRNKFKDKFFKHDDVLVPEVKQ